MQNKTLKTAWIPAIRVTEDIRKRLDAEALERDVGLATIIREAIRRWLKQEGC
jgi:predicted DNA-binding protein